VHRVPWTGGATSPRGGWSPQCLRRPNTTWSVPGLVPNEELWTWWVGGSPLPHNPHVPARLTIVRRHADQTAAPEPAARPAVEWCIDVNQLGLMVYDPGKGNGEGGVCSSTHRPTRRTAVFLGGAGSNLSDFRSHAVSRLAPTPSAVTTAGRVDARGRCPSFRPSNEPIARALTPGRHKWCETSAACCPPSQHAQRAGAIKHLLSLWRRGSSFDGVSVRSVRTTQPPNRRFKLRRSVRRYAPRRTPSGDLHRPSASLFECCCDRDDAPRPT